ncbi:MAG: hypothetical protein AB7S26_37355 [Sandaracinaceae bacterium]
MTLASTLRLAAILAVFAILSAGCQPGLTDDGEIAELDEAFFRCRVQPILTKNCGTFVCHGSGQRFFTLFGRNRLRACERMDGCEEERNAVLTPEERQHNFTAALTMVNYEYPLQSLLLVKPLELSAGGSFHQGAHEPFDGGDVFADPDDRELSVIREWIQGATEDPSCEEPPGGGET